MSFKNILLVCLLAIGIGASFGMLDVRLSGPVRETTSRAPESVRIQTANSTASRTNIDSDLELKREKAEALKELLTEHGIKSQ